MQGPWPSFSSTARRQTKTSTCQWGRDLGLSEEMLPTSKNTQSVPLTPFCEGEPPNHRIEGLFCHPTRGNRTTTSLACLPPLTSTSFRGHRFSAPYIGAGLYSVLIHSHNTEAVKKVKQSPVVHDLLAKERSDPHRVRKIMRDRRQNAAALQAGLSLLSEYEQLRA